MVLMLPFTDFDPAKQSLKTFIGDRWSTKFTQLFEINADAVAKEHHDALHRIAEEYRNTYGHGGFDKPGAAIAFHLPGIGALPATLSDIRDSPHFNFVPVDAGDLTRVKEIFDAVDTWLVETGAPHAMAWVKSGLDVRYDEDFRAEVAAARQSSEDFEAMLNAHSYFADQAANMDW